jgi:hypothetical protein
VLALNVSAQDATIAANICCPAIPDRALFIPSCDTSYVACDDAGYVTTSSGSLENKSPTDLSGVNRKPYYSKEEL